MQKQQTRVPARSFVPQRPFMQRVQPAQRDPELPRDEVSRCINIWAKLYRLRDQSFEADLNLPSRSWAGRALPRIERFE